MRSDNYNYYFNKCKVPHWSRELLNKSDNDIVFFNSHSNTKHHTNTLRAGKCLEKERERLLQENAVAIRVRVSVTYSGSHCSFSCHIQVETMRWVVEDGNCWHESHRLVSFLSGNLHIRQISLSLSPSSRQLSQTWSEQFQEALVAFQVALRCFVEGDV